MNFMLRLLRTKKDRDFILVMVDRFLKIAHFIACKKTENATSLAHLFIQEIVHLHGVLKTITFDRNLKFISKFWHYL